MPRRVVERQLVCSECGKPLRTERATAADAAEQVRFDDDEDADAQALQDADAPVATVVEAGPVCPRCAAMR